MCATLKSPNVLQTMFWNLELQGKIYGHSKLSVLLLTAVGMGWAILSVNFIFPNSKRCRIQQSWVLVQTRKPSKSDTAFLHLLNLLSCSFTVAPSYLFKRWQRFPSFLISTVLLSFNFQYLLLPLAHSSVLFICPNFSILPRLFFSVLPASPFFLHYWLLDLILYTWINFSCQLLPVFQFP